MSRAAGRMTGTPSGTCASSSPRTNRSSMIRPALTSGIDTLLERFDAEALDRLDEVLVRPRAQLEIGSGDVLDHVGDLAVPHGGTENGAEPGGVVRPAADRHLVKFLAVLLDAEDPDMADMVVAAGVDAARDVDVQPPETAGEVEILEAAGDLLGDRDGARVGEAAIVEARAGDDVGDEPDIGRGNADRVERPPERRQVALRHVRQYEILLVPDADLAEAVTIRQVGDGVHLRRGGVAGRLADRLERQRHDGIAGPVVVEDG